MFDDEFDFGVGNDPVVTYYEEDEPFPYDDYDYEVYGYDEGVQW
jgi:hypothetical protein